MKKIAIMQPYFFPYIGYFQLIHASDVFIVLDDVNFINRGWINRNKILVDGSEFLFTIPCLKVSQNRKINTVKIDYGSKHIDKLKTTVEQAYKKAPFFNDFAEIFFLVIEERHSSIAEFALSSVQNICRYLGIEKEIKTCSSQNYDNKNLIKADRLIDIAKKEKSNYYINAIGGQDIYTKEYFQNRGINLFFLDPVILPYKQFKNNFVPGLSILDVLMFIDKKDAILMLNSYNLN